MSLGSTPQDVPASASPTLLPLATANDLGSRVANDLGSRFANDLGSRFANTLGSRVANSQFSVEFAAVGRSFPRQGRAAADRGRAAAQDSRHQVIRGIGLTVRPGEVVGILGTSGCGKSTLLRIAAGLDSPTTGSVRIDGTPVVGIDGRCAFAFQEPRLLPWRTMAGNVTIGLPRDIDGDEGSARVARLLELVGLTQFAGHRPREVSGGMAQRASLARALARDPGVLLLDEPFASLDALTRMRMQDLLLDIHAAAPTTVLLVTHDVEEALQLSDRVVLLGTEPGRDGATVRRIVTVPGDRPRDRGSAEIAELRAQLLEGLGVSRHTH